jgi:hypothetical protein
MLGVVAKGRKVEPPQKPVSKFEDFTIFIWLLEQMFSLVN